jgi:hypothetical protein
MSAPGFRFIDLPSSAERLGITRNELLQLVDEGRIRPFSGKGQQSVFRASDVERLAQELKPARIELEAGTAEIAPAEDEAAPGERRRPRRRDPIKLIGTRLSMDARWAEISNQDISTWLDALEPVQFERVRKVSTLAIERLQRVLAMMDSFEQKSGLASSKQPADEPTTRPPLTP